MSIERTVIITVARQQPLNALATVANELVQLLAGPGGNPSEPDRMVRLAVEAITPEALAAGLVDDLCAMHGEFGATPVSISVDGFRVLEDGFRVWGVVGLSYTAQHRAPASVRLGTPSVTHADDIWAIEVSISIT